MKLLFLTVIPSPYQRQLFSALANEDSVELQIFYFTAGAHDREWKRPDMEPFERILDGRTLHAFGPSAHWNPGYASAILAAKPDLVVVSDYSAPTAQMAMRFLLQKRIPFVFWGEMPGFSRRSAVGRTARWLLQKPIDAASAVAAIGSMAVGPYKARFPGKRVFNIPYFCDLSPFREARARARGDRQTVDVLFSGQLIERKGVDLLVDAFLRVAATTPDLRLLLLGNGPEKAALAARVPENVRERVVFLGHKDPADLPDVFANADIFCLPSRHDGWGVVVNEALGAGLPIVVSDRVGAGRDLVEPGVNGFVTPSNDAVALAEALGRLAADPPLRAAFSAASTRLSENWGIEEGARRWSDAAATVLVGGARP